jgi:hypothetical protein
MTTTNTANETTVQTFTEREAKDARRSYINDGHTVTMIGFNEDSGMYEFGVFE